MSKSQTRRQPSAQRASRRGLLPFAGVDGEGGDVGGKHEFLMLRAGDRLLETGEPLSPYECFAFLADLPRDRIYVAFAFDYDVTMMIRRLPPSRVIALFDREARAIVDKDGKPTSRYHPVTVGHGQFEIDYLPHKEFKVRRAGEHTTHDAKWTVVSDTFTFFQTSFVRALSKWFADEPDLTPAIDKIAEGKAMRNSFGAVTEYERDYNQLECVMLERLMEKFRELCTDLDVKPRTWQGPGNLVSAVFRREGMPRKTALAIPPQVWTDANAAYCAGRFEVSTYGRIDNKVYQYDLNSAYASSYRDLPCLLHGKWEPITEIPPDGIYVADVTFHHRDRLRWNTLPVRSAKGNLLFPRAGRGWYWSPELTVAQQWADLEVHGGWKYVKCCDCRSFDWVYALYDERDRVGKTSGKGKVLKTILATIYGKLAQSKGHPVYSNPVWAGLIVSSCRSRLIDAALSVQQGADVYMLATDGMFVGNPRPGLTVGQDLGEWTLTEHDEMFIVQSGVYFMPTEKPKTRGVPQSKVIEYEPEFRSIWSRWAVQHSHDFMTETTFASVEIPLRVFIGAKLAYARDKLWSAGRWRNESKRVSFDWTTKRCLPELKGETLTTWPVEGSPTLVSRAPRWLVGGELPKPDPERLLLDEQPDWGDRLDWDDDDQ